MIKQLKTKYRITKEKDLYIVRSFEQGLREPYKYLCYFTIKDRKVFIEDKHLVKTIEEFDKVLNSHITSLEYDSQYYYPLWIEGYGTYLIVYDFLNSIGFKTDWTSNSEFIKTEESVYGKGVNLYFDFRGIYRPYKEEVRVYFQQNKSLYSTKCKNNPTEIIETIKSLLKPYYVFNSAVNFKSAEQVENEKQIEATLLKIVNNDLIKTDYKEQLKQKLQSLIDKL
jgi:hypothetical protein